MKSDKGFTLVEVLIAAVILFSALAISAEIFKSSTFSANKASQVARFYQVSPAAISAIKLQLKESSYNLSEPNLSGLVKIYGIEYSWSASLISNKAPAVYEGDTDVGPARFKRYTVNVSASLSQKRHDFSFEVSTW